MVEENVSRFIFIDESGSGAKKRGTVNKVVKTCAAVIVHFREFFQLKTNMEFLFHNHFHKSIKNPYNEVKGCNIPYYLQEWTTPLIVAEDFRSEILGLDIDSCVVVTQYGSGKKPYFPPQGMALEPRPNSEDIARFLLLERIDLHFKNNIEDDGNAIIVWDIENVKKLELFSDAVQSFTNFFRKEGIDGRIISKVLGGCSHDWAGLQAADFIANYSLHHRGEKFKLGDVNKEKSFAFQNEIYPNLMKIHGKIKGRGWVEWPPP